MDTEDTKVLGLLDHKAGLDARLLARATSLPKSTINSILYRLHREKAVFKIDGTPPLWVLPPRSPVTYVLIDLGNVHDALEPAIGYLEEGVIHSVCAYADKQYNGPGHDSTYTWTALSTKKNAADVKIVWDIAQFGSRADVPTRVLVVTKDKGFLSLEDVATRENEHLTVRFVETVDALRVELDV